LVLKKFKKSLDKEKHGLGAMIYIYIVNYINEKGGCEMITKKKVVLSTLLMIIIGVMFVVFVYNKPIQADKLYPDNYQFVSCFINKRFFSHGSNTAIPLDNSEVNKILEKFQVKRKRIDRNAYETTYILFELKIANGPDKWPKLYVFDDGRIWVDKDNWQRTLSYEVQGDQKDALYDELLEMITAYSK